MKLSLISEVFQTPSMDGVRSDIDMYSDNTRIASATYTFYDSPKGERIEYELKILTNRYAYLADKIFGFEKLKPEQYQELLAKMEEIGGNPAYIDFEADESYDKTGHNNEFFVYSKVIACIHDFVSRSRPVALKFSGYTSDMDRIYDRFIKMGNRIWPEHTYVPISPDVYVTKQLLAVLQNIPGFAEWYDYQIEQRNKRLDTALHSKKRERSQNIRNREIDKIVNNNIGKVITTHQNCEYTISSIRNNIVLLEPNNDYAKKRSSINGRPYISKNIIADKLFAGQYGNFLDLLIHFELADL